MSQRKVGHSVVPPTMDMSAPPQQNSLGWWWYHCKTMALMSLP